MRVRQLISRLLGTDVGAQAFRYLVVGGVVAFLYATLTLVFHVGLGFPIVVAITAAYICAVSVHFVLQRRVVFVEGGFALSTRQQIGRYIGLGAVQLPLSFAGTMALHRWAGLPQAMAYLLVTAGITAATFLLLRARIFHAEVPAVPPG